jgi:hypothetical protein
MPDGSNVRKTVADAVNRLQEKLLLCREDDTKSFFSLIIVSWPFACSASASVPVACRSLWDRMACCSCGSTC